MTTDLREELTALAETQSFSVDPSAWDRGRRARRNSRLARGAAALAVVAIVVGVGALAVRPHPVAPAGDVRGGAIPSRVDITNGEFEDDFAIGRASVALGGNHLVLIGAEDGRYHHFTIPDQVFALSPDGYRVAWWADDGVLDVAGVVRIDPDRIYIADLRTGDILRWAHNFGEGATVTSLAWSTDSTQLRWNGRADDGARRAAAIDVSGPSENDMQGRFGDHGIPSPSFDMAALPSQGEVTAAPFEKFPPRGSGRFTAVPVDRTLPADLYPDGAVVTPVGWADEDTLVAIIDPPPSNVVERPRLALLTSPDLPESEWIFREFLPRLPPEATSFAVDLIPDLTGDPDQELTHSFSATADRPSGDSNRVPLVAGGLLALLAGIGFIRMMQKRA